MKYTEVLQKKAAWDPGATSFNDTEFQWDTQEIQRQMHDSLKKHYVKLLANIFKRSTGKELKNPEKYIDPQFGFAVGRAANVDPKILRKLDKPLRDRLDGWSSTIKNIDPGLIMDQVDYVNSRKYYKPYNYKNYRVSKKTQFKMPRPLYVE